MAVFKDALKKGNIHLDELALLVGYESAGAFSAAFQRNVGQPPRSFARETGVGAPLGSGSPVSRRQPGR